MKKNAFTLIELLAVIVILAIISLIAVPIVLGIINDAKKSSEEESLKLYFDTVEKAITRKQLSSSNFNPDRCEIQSDGNLECFNNNETLGILQIEIKGKTPTNGTLTIKNGKIVEKNGIINNDNSLTLQLLSECKADQDVVMVNCDVSDINLDDYNYFVLEGDVTASANTWLYFGVSQNMALGTNWDFVHGQTNHFTYPIKTEKIPAIFMKTENKKISSAIAKGYNISNITVDKIKYFNFSLYIPDTEKILAGSWFKIYGGKGNIYPASNK